MSMTVVSDLQKLVKIKPAPSDTPMAFSERLARKANNIKDEDWETLEGDTQDWVNATLESLQKGAAFSLPTGIEAFFEADAIEADAAKAKEKKPPKEKKPAVSKKADEAAAPRAVLFGRDDVIVVNIKANPYREGTKSFAWFANYAPGMTVEEAVAAGTPRHHIRWDFKQGNISFEKK